MGILTFGAGMLYLTPQGGVPIKVGTLKNIDLSIDPGKITKLFGTQSYAISIARGDGDITAKASLAQVDMALIRGTMGGQATSGLITVASGEQWSILTSCTVLNAAGFVRDLGVIRPNGDPFTLVASNPAAGQYTVSGSGVYQFSAADVATSAPILISYAYSLPTGQTINITNTLQTAAVPFELILSSPFKSASGVASSLDVRLYSVVPDKLEMAFKNGEFGAVNTTFHAQDPGTGILGYISVSKAS